MLPTFVGIGAQRAGTTWIHECLAEHPEVCVPHVKKETHFFNRNFDRGVAWYESQFAVLPQHKAVGEITPNYLSHELAIPRMAEVVPLARLFVVLREPVDRAYSAYRLLHEQYEGLSFREACREGTLVPLGLYADQMARVFKYYPAEQVRVFLYDDIVADPRAFIHDLYAFIGVDPSVTPTSVEVRYNAMAYGTSQSVLKRLQLSWLVDAFKKTPVGYWFRRRHAASTAGNRRNGVSPADITYLKTLFHDDLVRLQGMIGRDLSHWM
jgi:hypothetical protein